ncbi:hypothetical protein [Actinophytocola oryzae]|uniref:Uncharacterized protein n=1 Tax=Actinophytocola oryzae TaxID=502181 RepID=A0A4V3FU80_9PSEU|nr:hypothetical protein [Actinophytocola oryzae]TDV54201.1 hypothetical protein CLV71_104672 [Actinophytocola oryzae]
MDRKNLLRVAVPGGLLVVGLTVGAVTTHYAESTEYGTPVAAPLRTLTETVEKTYTQTAPAPPPVTVTEGPPPPAAQFGEGLYLVGTDITPGEYRTDGPAPGGHCYWARLSDSAGTNIIANNLTEGPSRLTAVAGEYLEVNGCTFVTA